jgi:hypothetical protein
MRRWLPLAHGSAALFVVALALTLACNGDNSAPASPTQVIGATATALPTSTPRSAAALTGVPEVDALIDALLVEPARSRREAIQPLFRFTSLPCTYAQTGGEPQPPCRTGEEQDTPVEVMAFDDCALQYLRADELNQVVILLANSSMYAVYRATDAYANSADYVAILYDLRGTERQASSVLLKDGGITSFALSCTMTPEDYVTSLQLTDVVYEAEGGG